MKDPRIATLAKNLINYSCQLKQGEKVLIECVGLQTQLVNELVKEAYNVDAHPFVSIKDNEVERVLLSGCNEEQMKLRAKIDSERMAEMDAYIGIRAGNNLTELSDVPSEKMCIYSKEYMMPVHMDIRVPKTRWVVLRYPNHSMAQAADMSTEAFENFYFNVCNLDYGKMSKAMDPLVNLLEKTDKVHLKGEGTDLTFSIKDIPVVKCAGEMNIPDGEVYTTPVKDSVNGYITYNIPAVYQGYTFENIKLEFKDGKIINATANNTQK